MTADTVGGVWTYALELSRALGEYGVRVSLATMGAALRSDQWDAVHQLDNVRVFESDYKVEWMDEPWSDVDASGVWLQRLEQTVNPDLVHLNGYAHGALRWRAPSIVVAHSCVLSWWNAVKNAEASCEWNEYRRRVTSGIHAANAVAAVSDAMLADVVRFYGMPAKSLVIPNGRLASDFDAGPKEQFILASGRIWDDAKNIRALQAIAPELSWPVYIAGEGCDTASGTQWLGRLSPQALRPWFSRAAVYAAPAYYEPFGLSILEAALSGCALVLGDIPSLRENWRGAAVFVPPTDRLALKAEIEKLAMNPDLRQRMGTLARRRAALFTPARMAAGYLHAYALAMMEVGVPCG